MSPFHFSDQPAIKVKLFSGTASVSIAESIAEKYEQPLGSVTVQRFSDGEISPSYNESVRGAEVFLIQSLCPPAENLMELLLMIDAAKRASAAHITIVVPYFGYARQDRKDKPRVAIGAKLVANVLMAAGADRLMTCDLHAGQIQGFFDIPVDHLDGSAIFVPYLRSLNLENLVFAAPDVGGVGRARAFAKIFETEMVVCDKHRKRANEVASMQVIGDVTDANVVIVDDIVDTAGTICKAAELLKSKGARSVRAICTHPVLSGPAYDRLYEATALDQIIVSDTIPIKQQIKKLTVLSIADLFARAIKNVHTHESISSLFI